MPKTAPAKASLLLGSLIVSLCLLEAGVRMISPPSPLSPRLPLRPYMKRELHVHLRGVSDVSRYSTNQWGLRGDEPPKDWRNYYTIVAIGGSSTICYHLDDHKTWPYLLQEKLKEKNPKVWVGNGGMDGQSTRGHILFMKEAIPKIRPNAVIFLTGINDLGFSISEDKQASGNPYDRPYWKLQLFRSRLIQILFLWKLILFDHVTVVKDQGHGNFEPSPLPPDAVRLPPDPRSALPALADYRKSLEALIELGRHSNVRTLFLTQPMLFEDNAYWRGIAGSFYWIRKTKGTLSAADYWRLLDIYNQELLQVCKEQGVECLDLASLVPHDPEYFYDSVHFTEKGAELVAQKVSEFLRQ